MRPQCAKKRLAHGTHTIKGTKSASDESGRHRVGRSSRDIMSPAQRSALMARIRGKNTGPERRVAAMLKLLKVSFESHCGDLPGRPDFVSRRLKLAIFVDGDFWHGWRFSAWRHKLTGAWEEKIHENRRRDFRNRSKLRRMGWQVLKFWEHQVVRNPEYCVSKLQRAFRSPSR